MDTPELSPSSMKGGREYVQRLEELGMDISYAMWAFDQVLREFTLIIVTDFFDAKGPLEVSKVLFRAYNLSVTPREIDPFHVRLHSVNHAFVKDIVELGTPNEIQAYDAQKRPKGVSVPIIGGTAGGIEFKTEWLISAKRLPKRSSVDLSRRWDRFVRNVDRAAA